MTNQITQPLQGAAVTAVKDQAWVIGGVFQQDYYDDVKEEEYYYDYTIEEAGTGDNEHQKNIFSHP